MKPSHCWGHTVRTERYKTKKIKHKLESSLWPCIFFSPTVLWEINISGTIHFSLSLPLLPRTLLPHLWSKVTDTNKQPQTFLFGRIFNHRPGFQFVTFLLCFCDKLLSIKINLTSKYPSIYYLYIEKEAGGATWTSHRANIWTTIHTHGQCIANKPVGESQSNWQLHINHFSAPHAD